MTNTPLPVDCGGEAQFAFIGSLSDQGQFNLISCLFASHRVELE